MSLSLIKVLQREIVSLKISAKSMTDKEDDDHDLIVEMAEELETAKKEIEFLKEQA
tara:strand:- start:5031 stop:5198 length:168 start_codon:yes stop_codon:yes gene_type:complete